MENSFNKGARILAFTPKEKPMRIAIMRGLDINTDGGYLARRGGRVKHNLAERIYIEKVFLKYGVQKSDVWGQ
jgi:hypothetical protein